MAKKKTSPSAPSEAQSFTILIARYLEWLLVRNYSRSTVRSKRWYLIRFERWCLEREIERPLEVTRTLLERYQRWIYHYRQKDGRALTLSTQNGYLNAVFNFFRWLRKQNLILSNPAADLELPRVETRLPRRVLSVAEVEKVLNAIDVTQPLGLRDRAILEV